MRLETNRWLGGMAEFITTQIILTFSKLAIFINELFLPLNSRNLQCVHSEGKLPLATTTVSFFYKFQVRMTSRLAEPGCTHRWPTCTALTLKLDLLPY